MGFVIGKNPFYRYQVWSVTDASLQFSPVHSENLRVRQSYIFAIRLPDESPSISTALAPLREATHDAIRAGDAIAAECKGISFPLYTQLELG